MRKIIIAAAVLTILLVAGVVLGPGLVDWNAYKAEIAGVAKKATGRDMVINGNIHLSLLPAPTLQVEDVRVSNIAGGQAPDMVHLKSMDVRVSLAGLLAGRIDVGRVTLVEPQIVLERLADGSANWTFAAPASDAQETVATSSPTSSSPSDADKNAPDVRVDTFSVQNATVIYRDLAAQTEERLADINAVVNAESLSGPFRSSGTLTARGTALEFAVSIGHIIEQRTVPATITVKTEANAGRGQASISGVVLGLSDKPRFKGTVTVAADDTGALVRKLANAKGPAMPFSVSGTLEANATDATLRDVTIGFGDMTGAANVDIRLGDAIGVAASVRFGRLDVDAVLAAMKPKSVLAEIAEKEAASDEKKAQQARKPEKQTNTAANTGGFTLPKNVAASLDLGIEAISVQGAAVRKVALNAELSGGEITLNQVSAQLPGGTDLVAFGFVEARDGQPFLEADVEANVSDTRGLARWFGVSMDALPTDRLRKVSVTAKLSGSPDQAKVSNINVQFDSSKLTGTASTKLAARPFVGLDLVLDKINVDAYQRRTPMAAKGKAKPAASGGDKKEVSAKKGAEKSDASVWQALAFLKSMDGDAKVRVRHLTLGGQTIAGANVDASLKSGAITVRNLGFDDAARASLKISGTVKKLGTLTVPELESGTLALLAPSPSKLVQLVGGKAPPMLKRIGSAALSVRAAGSLLSPDIAATVKAAKATASVDGKLSLSLLGLAPSFSGRVSADHPALASLLTKLGLAYRPSGPVGGVTLSSAVDATARLLTFKDVALAVGKRTMNGAGTVALDGPRPKIGGTFALGTWDVTPFIPAERRASLTDGNIIPAAFYQPPTKKRAFVPVVQRGAGPAKVWPKDAIDLSALGSVDADLNITADVLQYQAYVLETADVGLDLVDGALKLRRFTGQMFGGGLTATGALDGRAIPAWQADVNIDKVSAARLFRAMGEKGGATGTVTATAALASSGRSIEDWVHGLNGKGNVAATGIDMQQGGKDGSLAPLLGILNAVGQLNLSGTKKKGLADINAPFVIANGVATSDPLTVSSNIANGTAKLVADLPAWTMDMNGTLKVGKSVLSQLLAAKAKMRDSYPFRVYGRLDSPNVKIKGAGTAGGIPLPSGITKFLQKKGLGGILGGATQQQPAATSSRPPPLPPKSGTSGTSSGNTGGKIAPPPPPPGGSSAPAPAQKVDPAKELLRRLLNR